MIKNFNNYSNFKLSFYGLTNKFFYLLLKKSRHSKDKSRIKKLRDFYYRKITNDEYFSPSIIHIETRTKCSGCCSFCLASFKTDPRDDGLMSEEMVSNILNQLQKLNFNKRLSFYNNNEPFMDKRIFSFISEARKKIPNAFLELKTNGKGLKINDVLEIFDCGLDYLYINDYVDAVNFKSHLHSRNIIKLKEQLKDIRRFKGQFKTNNNFERLSIDLRYEGAIMNTRAGTSPNRKKDVYNNSKPFKTKNWICFRPCEMMTINRNGDVATCSEDLLYEEKMGNILKSNIKDIWCSEKYIEIRKNLLDSNRNILSTCKKCDYSGFTQEAFIEHNF